MELLLSGNAAIARGAYENGVSVASAYPSTPSTKILETIANEIISEAAVHAGYDDQQINLSTVASGMATYPDNVEETLKNFNTPREIWEDAIVKCVPEHTIEVNLKAFHLGLQVE